MKLSEFKPTEEVLERVRKCTAAEEIKKIALEYNVELTAVEISNILKDNRIRELNDQQLNQVTGGDDWVDEKAEHLPPNHGKHIGKYESQGHIGERVYCVRDDDPKQFCWGILKRSYELEITWGTTRVYDIFIEGWNHFSDTLYAYYKNDGYPHYIHENIGELFIEIRGNDATLFLYNK